MSSNTTPISAIPTPLADLLTRSAVVDLTIWRGVRLIERAMAGDADAAIEWLQRYGSDQWSLADMPEIASLRR